MVPACCHLLPMVQVSMVMVLAMECLMQDGAFHGFAEALVEDSVEAEAGVAAEVGLVIGGRF
jgi:hypothetical protein